MEEQVLNPGLDGRREPGTQTRSIPPFVYWVHYQDEWQRRETGGWPGKIKMPSLVYWTRFRRKTRHHQDDIDKEPEVKTTGLQTDARWNANIPSSFVRLRTAIVCGRRDSETPENVDTNCGRDPGNSHSNFALLYLLSDVQEASFGPDAGKLKGCSRGDNNSHLDPY